MTGKFYNPYSEPKEEKCHVVESVICIQQGRL